MGFSNVRNSSYFQNHHHMYECGSHYSEWDTGMQHKMCHLVFQVSAFNLSITLDSKKGVRLIVFNNCSSTLENSETDYWHEVTGCHRCLTIHQNNTEIWGICSSTAVINADNIINTLNSPWNLADTLGAINSVANGKQWRKTLLDLHLIFKALCLTGCMKLCDLFC